MSNFNQNSWDDFMTDVSERAYQRYCLAHPEFRKIDAEWGEKLEFLENHAGVQQDDSDERKRRWLSDFIRCMEAKEKEEHACLYVQGIADCLKVLTRFGYF